MLSDDGRGMLYVPFLNYADGNLDAVREMLRDPHSVPGLSDGGAHCGIICDASFPTYLLTHWTRDRSRGEKLSIPFVVAAQSRKTALSVGLYDRGVIASGYKADLNVIDYDRLHLHPPKVHYDLPVGGRRLLQQVDGYDATIVSGVVTQRGGIATGARPGRLVRGAQGSLDTRCFRTCALQRHSAVVPAQGRDDNRVFSDCRSSGEFRLRRLGHQARAFGVGPQQQQAEQSGHDRMTALMVKPVM